MRARGCRAPRPGRPAAERRGRARVGARSRSRRAQGDGGAAERRARGAGGAASPAGRVAHAGRAATERVHPRRRRAPAAPALRRTRALQAREAGQLIEHAALPQAAAQADRALSDAFSPLQSPPSQDI